jgi:hypothetical protein
VPIDSPILTAFDKNIWKVLSCMMGQNRDAYSHVINESDVHSNKHDTPRIAREPLCLNLAERRKIGVIVSVESERVALIYYTDLLGDSKLVPAPSRRSVPASSGWSRSSPSTVGNRTGRTATTISHIFERCYKLNVGKPK